MKFAILPLVVVLAASCASDKQPDMAAAETGPRSLSQRLNEGGGYMVDSDGNWVPRNNQRSSFESQGTSPYFKGTNPNQNKSYKAGEYARKSWWGNKDFGSQSYQGDTDGSRFSQSSRHDGQDARESSVGARTTDPYQTGGFQTGSARESTAGNLAKPSDVRTDVRRRVFQEPEIIDWRQQRTLTLEQSRGILGR